MFVICTLKQPWLGLSTAPEEEFTEDPFPAAMMMSFIEVEREEIESEEEAQMQNLGTKYINVKPCIDVLSFQDVYKYCFLPHSLLNFPC